MDMLSKRKLNVLIVHPLYIHTKCCASDIILNRFGFLKAVGFKYLSLEHVLFPLFSKFSIIFLNLKQNVYIQTIKIYNYLKKKTKHRHCTSCGISFHQ